MQDTIAGQPCIAWQAGQPCMTWQDSPALHGVRCTVIPLSRRCISSIKSMCTSRRCISSIKYSPDGSRLACGSWDQCAYLFDTENGYDLLYILKGNSSSVEFVNFSKDGLVLQTNSKVPCKLYRTGCTGLALR